MPAISLKDVVKRYGQQEALRDVTFDVPEGSLFGLLGNNGAGKTTTINLITGQDKPDSGTIRVLGEDPTTDPTKVRQEVGILPEREEPPSALTPREYFQFVADVRDISDSSLERRITEWSSRLDFAENIDTVISDLSLGQRQMVIMTQAFLSQPPLIIIDEPLVNLDPARQKRVKQALLQYRNRGNTLVLSTHNLSFAEDVCSQTAILHNGELVDTVQIDQIDGSLREYYADKTIPLPSSL